MSPRNPQHSCKSFEHYTPADYVEAARYVLGRIELDPASSARANETVGADRFYTKDDNGLAKPWFGRVYLNPPNNRTGYLIKAFWRRANQHALFHGGSVLWAGYSLGPLARLHACDAFDDGTPCPGPISWPFVIIGPQAPCTTTGGRICWIDGETGEPGMHPGHGNYFCLLGGDQSQRARFRERFGTFGSYHGPYRLPAPSRNPVFELIDVLRHAGPMSKRELARALGVRNGVVGPAIDRLAVEGQVRKVGRKWVLV